MDAKSGDFGNPGIAHRRHGRHVALADSPGDHRGVTARTAIYGLRPLRWQALRVRAAAPVRAGGEGPKHRNDG